MAGNGAVGGDCGDDDADDVLCLFPTQPTQLETACVNGQYEGTER